MIARRSMLVIGLLALLVVHAQRPHAIQAAGNVVVTDCSNATQLHTAATSPGVTQITFDCGAAPATIPITGYMSVQGDVTIDGGGKVTLDGGTTSPFFQVYAAGSLSLRNLALQNGAYTGIHAIENFGATSLERVVMRSNKSAGQGGAIANYATLTVRSSLFEGNQASTSSASGGAIFQGGGSTSIETSTFSGNQSSGTGGAIACANGTLTLTASTITASTAGGHGAAIYSTCGTTIANSTMSGNSTPTAGGAGLYLKDASGTVTATTIANNNAVFGAGVYHEGSGTLALRATLLAGNTAGNCDGVLQSQGYNMSTDTNCAAFTQSGDRQNVALPLGPLQFNGGPTKTHMPLPGNPAINAIPSPCPLPNDQRGVARPQSSACDVGAVEVSWAIYLPLVVR